MTTKITFIALAAAAATLSACGGGGTSINTTPDYATLVARAETAATGVIDLDTGAVIGTERTALPASGQATYTGYVGGDVADGSKIIGELTLTATFAGDAAGGIEGSATNFRDDSNVYYDGSVPLTGGQIDPQTTTGDDRRFFGDLIGPVENTDTNQSVAVNLGLDGWFFEGDNAVPDTPTKAAGWVDGTFGGQQVEGAFIATQQP